MRPFINPECVVLCKLVTCFIVNCPGSNAGSVQCNISQTYVTVN